MAVLFAFQLRGTSLWHDHTISSLPNLSAAVLSWMSEYLLVPLFMNRFTACGKGTLEAAIRNLIPDKVIGPEALHAQPKVIQCSHTH